MEKHSEHQNKVLQLALNNGLTLKQDRMQVNESGLDFLTCFAEDSEGTSWVLRTPRRDDIYWSMVTDVFREFSIGQKGR